ncbi:MAG: hypothetical protein H6696_12475 [Deferribacteres bacterium]|nr:hypothetical protein [candidate division KSB1 bacterium]MCB9502742.1 hypothetical protein [Deferribacteres bacterium]
MNLSKGNQLTSGFLDLLVQNGISYSRSNISRNVFSIKEFSTLIYIKSRSELPFKWGITANVVSKLNSSVTNWISVLLFQKPYTGYLLSSDDVNYYIKNVWPLAADGDYKPATGSYLSKNKPFNSIQEFIQQFNSLKD